MIKFRIWFKVLLTFVVVASPIGLNVLEADALPTKPRVVRGLQLASSLWCFDK
jgi:hypothetical protein